MASIAKKRGKFGVRWRGLDGRERWRTCPSAAVARQLKRQIETSIALGRDFDPRAVDRQPRLFGDDGLIRCWLRDRARVRNAATVHRYAFSMDLFERFLTERDSRYSWTSADFSRDLMADGWAWLRSPATGLHGRQRSIVTANRVLRVWEMLWSWCADHDDHHTHTPRMRPLELPKPVRREVVAPTFAELDAMLAELDAARPRRVARVDGWSPDWIVRLVWLARFTGLRRSEALSLQWEAIDLERRRLHLTHAASKGGISGRVVPLHPQLCEELASWGTRHGFVVDAPARERTQRGHASRSLRTAWRAADVPESRWHGQPLHCTRKTLETHWTVAGVPDPLVRLLLGHQQRDTGGVYYLDALRLREESWSQLVEAVASIPRVGASQIRRLRPRAERARNGGSTGNP